MPAGSLFGALAVTSLADRIGRKNTIILASIIWVIGGILQCAAIVRASSLSYLGNIDHSPLFLLVRTVVC